MTTKTVEFELKPLNPTDEQIRDYFLAPTDDGDIRNSEETEIRVYPKRWIILTLSCLIQLIDQIIFLSLAPVANYSDSFYGEFTVNYLAMICTACSIPASIIAPWFGSKFSLRVRQILR